MKCPVCYMEVPDDKMEEHGKMHEEEKQGHGHDHGYDEHGRNHGE